MDSANPIYYDNLKLSIKLDHVNINVMYLRYESPRPQWNVGNHFHTSYELHFIAQGEGTVWIGEKSFKLKKGTFYLTGPNIYHEQKTDLINPMSEFSLSIEVEVSKRGSDNKVSDAEQIITAFHNKGFFICEEAHKTIELFERIFTELKNSEIGYYYNIKNLLSQIIIDSARYCTPNAFSKEPPPFKTTNDKRRFLLDFYFGEGYKTLTFEDLMDKLGVSERQLNRIINQYYNMSFKKKLLQIRLENAIGLLNKTDLKVEEIAEKVGFSNVSYFYRVFKEIYGVTPKEYREDI